MGVVFQDAVWQATSHCPFGGAKVEEGRFLLLRPEFKKRVYRLPDSSASSVESWPAFFLNLHPVSIQRWRA
jgi:hypothetical protein